MCMHEHSWWVQKIASLILTPEFVKVFCFTNSLHLCDVGILQPLYAFNFLFLLICVLDTIFCQKSSGNSHASNSSWTLYLVMPVTWHSKNVPHDNIRLITMISWVCHLSQILARIGIHPNVHPTSARIGSIATCRMSSFMLIHIHENNKAPTPSALPCTWHSSFLEVFL